MGKWVIRSILIYLRSSYTVEHFSSWCDKLDLVYIYIYIYIYVYIYTRARLCMYICNKNVFLSLHKIGSIWLSEQKLEDKEKNLSQF